MRRQFHPIWRWTLPQLAPVGLAELTLRSVEMVELRQDLLKRASLKPAELIR
jgi:hypothetical protein